MLTVAILGASGYAGGELVRFVDGHPDMEVAFLGAHSNAGKKLGSVHPHLGGPDRVLQTFDVDEVGSLDLVFMALPHGASAEPAMQLSDTDVKIVDLGSDFRLDTPERYIEAYTNPHPYPEELGTWAFGIPELFSDSISTSDRVAVPGCYPTSAIIPLAPLLADGLISGSGIVVNSLSGVSGAGRGAISFEDVHESVKAYNVLTHRHRPEIERALDTFSPQPTTVIFTPHLVPMFRGLLSTTYATATQGTTLGQLNESFDTAYKEAVFVHRLDVPPETRWAATSNNILVSMQLDERTATVVIVSVLDNLVKGAAGQAVQNANLMFGFDEDAGLPTTGWMP